jgi:hypothetical protein
LRGTVHGVCGVDRDDMFVHVILVHMVEMAVVISGHCACRKSNSDILLMKSAEKWRRHNATNGTMVRGDGASLLTDRCVRA